MKSCVDVTTRRSNGRLVLDRSLCASPELAEIYAKELADIMFGEGDYSVIYGEYLGENMFNEDVTIHVVHVSDDAPVGIFK